MTTAERLEHANTLIEIISRHGRRFFFDKESGAVARLELGSRGRVRWLRNEQQGYAAHSDRWGYSGHAGKIIGLAQALREYILHGYLLHTELIAPATSRGDGWGYGAEAAAAVRNEAHVLPLFAWNPEAKKENS